MCWWYGPSVWGFWWIFPLIGIGFMVIIMLMMRRFLHGRMGCCGTSGVGEMDALRKEIQELKDELDRLKRKP